jgi:hypothetical protein
VYSLSPDLILTLEAMFSKGYRRVIQSPKQPSFDDTLNFRPSDQTQLHYLIHTTFELLHVRFPELLPPIIAPLTTSLPATVQMTKNGSCKIKLNQGGRVYAGLAERPLNLLVPEQSKPSTFVKID